MTWREIPHAYLKQKVASWRSGCVFATTIAIMVPPQAYIYSIRIDVKSLGTWLVLFSVGCSQLFSRPIAFPDYFKTNPIFRMVISKPNYPAIYSTPYRYQMSMILTWKSQQNFERNLNILTLIEKCLVGTNTFFVDNTAKGVIINIWQWN